MQQLPLAIAKQVGFRGYEKTITGDELMKLTMSRINNLVMGDTLFLPVCFQKPN